MDNFKGISVNELLPIETIVRLLNQDLEAYGEDLEAIRLIPEYWQLDNNDNQRYWTAWFSNSDMAEWNY